MGEKNNKPLTPRETEQALSGITEKLMEMDKAEGVFGEEMQDEELDEVAGGIKIVTIPPVGTVCNVECSSCHLIFPLRKDLIGDFNYCSTCLKNGILPPR